MPSFRWGLGSHSTPPLGRIHFSLGLQRCFLGGEFRLLRLSGLWKTYIFFMPVLDKYQVHLYITPVPGTVTMPSEKRR